MIEALKKVDKKILIMAGVIIMLPILLIIFLAIIQSCSDRKVTYDKYESKMIGAAKNYFEDKKLIPTVEKETKKVSLSKLVEEGYIKSTDKLMNDDTCKGSVVARRNGSTIEKNEGGFVNYTVTLTCDNYSTTHLIDELKKNIVTEGSGLYQVGNIYIFKGDDPKNYLNFFGDDYRIVSIDENNTLKLLKVQNENESRSWDTKYNTEANDSVGKNIYKDSSILRRLNEIYNNEKAYDEFAKEKMLAQDICIDAKDINNLDLNSNATCNNVLTNQVISLISANDFALASLDSECLNIRSRSCRNYNYLRSLALSTWTVNAVSNNSYQVYYLENGLIDYKDADKNNFYNVVIYIDGNELFKSGKGTNDEPFIIE